MTGLFRKFEMEPGGWLLLSLLYFFGDLRLMMVVLGCVGLHELGHLLMLRKFGVPVRRLNLGFSGLTIWYPNWILSGRQAFAVAAAGPAAGILTGVLASFAGNLLHHEGLLLFAGGNAVLSVFNLLPAKPLDGWRLLSALWPQKARSISIGTAVLLLAAGIGAMLAGYGIGLAVMGIVLLLQEDRTGPRRLRGYKSC